MFRLGTVAGLVGALLTAVAVSVAPAPAFAGPGDPCVSVSHPFENDGRISGVEDIPVFVSHPDLSPTRAELFVDGVSVGTDGTPSSVTEGSCGIVYLFEVPWDTTRWQDGPHQLTALATMSDGGQHWSPDALILDVDNN